MLCGISHIPRRSVLVGSSIVRSSGFIRCNCGLAGSYCCAGSSKGVVAGRVDRKTVSGNFLALASVIRSGGNEIE